MSTNEVTEERHILGGILVSVNNYSIRRTAVTIDLQSNEHVTVDRSASTDWTILRCMYHGDMTVDDANGDVFVTDWALKCVVVYDRQGVELTTIDMSSICQPDLNKNLFTFSTSFVRLSSDTFLVAQQAIQLYAVAVPSPTLQSLLFSLETAWRWQTNSNLTLRLTKIKVSTSSTSAIQVCKAP